MHIPLLPKLFQLLIFLLYNSKIAPTCKIGKGTKLICGGLSVLIHYEAVIGENCNIGAHCCILGKSPYRNVPKIGNNVFVGHNTVICGPVHIGDGAIIGNGAIVTKSVPDNAIVVGAPARIIGNRDSMGYNLLDPTELKDDIMPYLEYDDKE